MVKIKLENNLSLDFDIKQEYTAEDFVSETKLMLDLCNIIINKKEKQILKVNDLFNDSVKSVDKHKLKYATVTFYRNKSLKYFKTKEEKIEFVKNIIRDYNEIKNKCGIRKLKISPTQKQVLIKYNFCTEKSDEETCKKEWKRFRKLIQNYKKRYDYV